MFPDPAAMPTRIDLLNVLPVPGSNRASVVVQLSLLQADKLRRGRVTVAGKLGFAAGLPAAGVVVYGCGASNVTCSVKDSTGKLACRRVERCVTTQAAAKAHVSAMMQASTLCKSPV